MTPIDKQQAANLMGVPLAWVNAMVEIGALTAYQDETGALYIDEEEIHAKGYTDPKLKAVSLEHLRALMRKVGIGGG